MNENEQKAGSVADQKSKIRERYKGINPDELDVIPALPQEDIFAVENEQRVAVYATSREMSEPIRLTGQTHLGAIITATHRQKNLPDSPDVKTRIPPMPR